MPDDTKTPPNELPPSDQAWGIDMTTIREFLSNTAQIVFEYYNSLCESGMSRTEAIVLAQLFQTQYLAVVLNIIHGGKPRKND